MTLIRPRVRERLTARDGLLSTSSMSSLGRSSFRSPAGRCRSPTRGSARSTRRCARTPGCSTSPTWARSRSRGPARSPSCSGCSPTTSPRSRSAAPSTPASATRTGGVLDDLFAYRLGGDRYLIVTNAANHEADLAWLGRWSRGFDVAVRDVADRYAMLAVQGPHARAVARIGARDRAAAADARRGGPRRRPAGARLRHRLHRRGRGRAADRPRGRAADLGASCSTPASSPAASAPATPCGSRSASPCTATT